MRRVETVEVSVETLERREPLLYAEQMSRVRSEHAILK
jgi:hypothetical protein